MSDRYAFLHYCFDKCHANFEEVNVMSIMRKLLCIAILCVVVFPVAIAEEIRSYTLCFSKERQDAANLHIKCSFSLDFQNEDSVIMNFGGGQEFSVDNLKVDSVGFEYNQEAKNIVFRKRQEQVVHVNMEYNYTNLSAFFIYGEGKAELWETSFGEYFYPYVPNTFMDVALNVETPDSLSLICSYPLESDDTTKYSGKLNHILSQSLTLAFIRNDAYQRTDEYIPGKLSIYQIKGMQCGKDRYDELLELTKASITFFSRVYGEDYISEDKNVTALPVYLFHNGKGFSNRYNVGFISASQEKFSTYPDIYPLVHEIGHRWLGEWTLLIDDGQSGAYFIKETLNEFMTLMFIRYVCGSEYYESQLDRCKSEYEKIKGTPQDEPVVNVVTNNNNTVIYRKGPLALIRIAEQIGYGELMSVISGFYKEYAGKYPLKYTDFIDMVNESHAGVGDQLNLLLTTKSL